MQSKVIQTAFLRLFPPFFTTIFSPNFPQAAFFATFFLFFAQSTPIFAQSTPQEVIDSTIKVYIAAYSQYAVAEMERTGIPASVTLAQGICESRFGTSNVALKARNHFGIKCYKSWKGKRYFHKDDEYKDGKLIPSCFRYYATVADSYRDHSDFLISRPWYDQLFKLESNDYKGWAIGLRKAGYAHAVDYEERLYKYINKFELTQFDKKGYKLNRKKLKIETVSPSDSTQLSEEVSLEPTHLKSEKSTVLIPKSVADEAQDTVLAAVNNDNAPIEKIELPTKKTGLLKKQEPAKTATEKAEIIYVPLDSAITFIPPSGAQEPKNVLKGEKNAANDSPGTNNGDKTKTTKTSLVALGQHKSLPLPSPSKKTDLQKNTDGGNDDDKKAIYIVPSSKKDSVKIPSITTTIATNKEAKEHHVAIGETLYKIARQYNVSLDKICELNNLTINSPIAAGQVLVISD